MHSGKLILRTLCHLLFMAGVAGVAGITGVTGVTGIVGVVAVAGATEVLQPESILVRNVQLISGADQADTVAVNILVKDGNLKVITRDRIRKSEAELVINANGGFVLGSLDLGEPASFLILNEDPRRNVEVLLDTRSHATFAIHEGKILLNTLMPSEEPAESEDDDQGEWLAYTPPPMALPMSYRDEDKWNRWDYRWVSGLFTAGLLLDRQSWPSQDAGSEQQVGDLAAFDGAEVRGLRFGAIGTINFEEAWTYVIFGATHAFDAGFDATEDDDFSLLDYRVDARLPWSLTLSLGKQKEPASLQRTMGLVFLPFQERTVAADALLPARSVGAVVSRAMPGGHGAWAVGAFNNWFDVGRAFNKTATVFAGRVSAGISPIGDESSMIHGGLNLRYSDAKQGIHYVSTPEFHHAPLYHDTGALNARKSLTYGAELGWRMGPFWAHSEGFLADVDSPTSGDPGFVGYHVTASWALTGEMRAYNRRAGVFGPLPISRSVYSGGRGAWELAARWSELDMNDGLVDGGRSQIASLGVNWWLTPFFQFSINYRHIELDRLGTTGVSDGINTRITLLLE